MTGGPKAAVLWPQEALSRLGRGRVEGRWFQFPGGCNDLSEDLERIIGPQVAEAEVPVDSPKPFQVRGPSNLFSYRSRLREL
jgi:hypothetical protein